ncbi:hypothetical protein F4804DRAFT_107711 [Jackrogersella minutella]|nr:hypothetical protein F4804DRAFT_107711 [Jackrogersella minutella]
MFDTSHVDEFFCLRSCKQRPPPKSIYSSTFSQRENYSFSTHFRQAFVLNHIYFLKHQIRHLRAPTHHSLAKISIAINRNQSHWTIPLRHSQSNKMFWPISITSKPPSPPRTPSPKAWGSSLQSDDAFAPMSTWNTGVSEEDDLMVIAHPTSSAQLVTELSPFDSPPRKSKSGPAESPTAKQDRFKRLFRKAPPECAYHYPPQYTPCRRSFQSGGRKQDSLLKTSSTPEEQEEDLDAYKDDKHDDWVETDQEEEEMWSISSGDFVEVVVSGGVPKDNSQKRAELDGDMVIDQEKLRLLKVHPLFAARYENDPKWRSLVGLCCCFAVLYLLVTA